jgi:uncharacterized lipoprotein YmbA
MSAWRTTAVRRAAALAVVVLLGACAAVTPTRFYTLSSEPGEPALLPTREVAVGVGPVTLPEYLNRPQLLIHDSSNRITLSDFDNWIEPLDGLFARTLAENLSRLLESDEVLATPQRRPFRPDYQVGVDVTRFDLDGGGGAVLEARWWLLGARGDQVLQRARSRIVEPAAAGDRAADVRALSMALGGLSREIAAALVAEAGG